MEPIYFAAGYYYPTEMYQDKHKKRVSVSMVNKPKQFRLVSPSNDNSELPYITKNSDGLRLTSHHANLYRLEEDGKTATLVRWRCSNVALFDKDSKTPIRCVLLTNEHINALQRAISRGRYVD